MLNIIIIIIVIFLKNEIVNTLVIYLVRCSGRNKDGVTEALDDAESNHSILFVQSSTEVFVQVETLVMDGIIFWFKGFSFFQCNLYEKNSLNTTIYIKNELIKTYFVEKISNTIGVLSQIDVPQRSWLGSRLGSRFFSITSNSFQSYHVDL